MENQFRVKIKTLPPNLIEIDIPDTDPLTTLAQNCSPFTGT